MVNPRDIAGNTDKEEEIGIKLQLQVLAITTPSLTEQLPGLCVSLRIFLSNSSQSLCYEMLISPNSRKSLVFVLFCSPAISLGFTTLGEIFAYVTLF